MHTQAKVMRAGGTIRTSRFVALSTTENNTVLEANAGDKIFGVSREGGRSAPIPLNTTSPVEAAQDGDSVNVYPLGCEALVEAGSTITVGQRLTSNDNGEAVPLTADGSQQEFGAYALEGGADGELIKVWLIGGSHTEPTTTTT